MTTVLQARPQQFVSTPSIERVSQRALRYLHSGYSVHLRGPAGTGKTTLALHLANVLNRPMMMLFGDDESKTSDLVGNQTGFTRKKVVDNFIHSVVKMEDEVRQNWVDSRLTLACREGFTLIYDEFNRSRPETNNVLLSALEEKLLTLPPHKTRAEYVRVHPNFRVIFTSNPTEYCGVHGTQDALMDRLITINMPEPDELTQQEIVTQKTKIDRISAGFIILLVKEFRLATHAKDSSGLRSCLIIAKICHDHGIQVVPESAEFRDICQDVLLSRSNIPLGESSQVLWRLFNTHINSHPAGHQAEGVTDPAMAEGWLAPLPPSSPDGDVPDVEANRTPDDGPLGAGWEGNDRSDPLHPVSDRYGMSADNASMEAMANGSQGSPAVATAPVAIESLDLAVVQGHTATAELNPLGLTTVTFKPSAVANGIEELMPLQLNEDTQTESDSISPQPQSHTQKDVQANSLAHAPDGVPYEREVYYYLKHSRDIRPSQIEAALGIDRFQTVNALRSLHEKGLLTSLQLPIPSVQPNPKGNAS
ncbi:MAG: gas vesicle protein GvpN [Leptolyngbyaceae bacterium]|nr:gas vesicle protein GvpN [Leptolyngbyaceae bacterium]